MRKALILILGLSFIPAAMTFAHHGPASVTIDAAKAKQPAVPFSHEKHSTKLVQKCETCHHTNKGMTADNAAKAKVQKCSSCHLDPKDKAPSMRQASLQTNPFHSGCIGCHKDQKKGPTVCKDCHVKK